MPKFWNKGKHRSQGPKASGQTTTNRGIGNTKRYRDEKVVPPLKVKLEEIVRK